MPTFTHRHRRMLRPLLLCYLVQLLGWLTLYLWHHPFRAAPQADRFELLASVACISDVKLSLVATECNLWLPQSATFGG